jgi:hypothetical protein
MVEYRIFKGDAHAHLAHDGGWKQIFKNIASFVQAKKHLLAREAAEATNDKAGEHFVMNSLWEGGIIVRTNGLDDVTGVMGFEPVRHRHHDQSAVLVTLMLLDDKARRNANVMFDMLQILLNHAVHPQTRFVEFRVEEGHRIDLLVQHLIQKGILTNIGPQDSVAMPTSEEHRTYKGHVYRAEADSIRRFAMMWLGPNAAQRVEAKL